MVLSFIFQTVETSSWCFNKESESLENNPSSTSPEMSKLPTNISPQTEEPPRWHEEKSHFKGSVWVWEWNRDNESNDLDRPVRNEKDRLAAKACSSEPLPDLSYFSFVPGILTQPKLASLIIILLCIVIEDIFPRNCCVQGIGYILWGPQKWIKRDAWTQRVWHLGRKMTVVCKYPDEKGGCLERSCGNSRGVKVTLTGRVGRERRKGNSSSMEFNLRWELRNVGSRQG